MMFAKDYLRSHFYRNDQIIEEGYEYEQIMNNPDVLNLSKFLSKNGEEIIIAENVLNYTKIMFLNDNKITDYDRYQMKYKNKNSDPGDSFDSEVLYWEAVHEGEIDPTQKNSSMTDPQTYFEDLSDVYSYDKYEVLRKYINIIIQSDNLPISMESDIYSSISGYGENKLNKMANIGYKKTNK
ncbi:hypothetical protein OMP38_03070 [Cohnella ginsengisoli]|uniref:Uncharacterized protein n=1 Tax=Cohnella ginsengisoli TaxID=425004 RepID=A0A9X4KD46_9BACL|nr:hypothetical protein [Cohnella ginsengisoli]MDG0789944.1 hypothetical protein [Cohnella ginsengisoli]